MSGAPLVAGARRLGPAFDLIANYEPDGFFFERSGLGVSASATAGGFDVNGGPRRIEELARVAGETLGAIRRNDDGPSAVAVGAIPFDEAEPASLAIPSRAAVRRRTGDTWRIDVWPEGGAPGETEPRGRWVGGEPHQAFADIQVRPDPEPFRYAAAVGEATRRIAAGELRKIVLARSLLVEAGRELDPKRLLWRLRAVDPDCFAFAVPTFSPEGRRGRARGVLVGASPELLVSKARAEVRATPLAGSAPRFGDREEDRASAERLLASEKDREEHAAVSEFVELVLGSFCDRLDHPEEPELLGTANVWHLATPFHGRLRDPARSVLDLVAELHPTPAVCGAPRDGARKVLGELETLDRGCYAGPVGWVDGNGDGEWAIGLRCAEVAGSAARLFAGAGIVAGSVPELELDETERKFRALLDSLRWG